MITSTIETILDNLFGFEIEQSVMKKRIHHQLRPNKAYVEKYYPSNFISELKNYGHDIEELDDSSILGVVQAIYQQEDGWLSAVSDPRRYGKPAGY